MAARLAWGQVVADRWFRAWGMEHGALGECLGILAKGYHENFNPDSEATTQRNPGKTHRHSGGSPEFVIPGLHISNGAWNSRFCVNFLSFQNTGYGTKTPGIYPIVFQRPTYGSIHTAAIASNVRPDR